MNKSHFLMPSRALLLVAALSAASPPALAAALAGKVTTPDGKPAYGAMVTVFDESREKRETVFTDADGQYLIRTPYSGQLDVRVRLANYEDNRISRSFANDDLVRVDLALKPFASPQAASDALSASAHNARLPWKNAEKDRPPFISTCNYCHQMGNEPSSS